MSSIPSSRFPNVPNYEILEEIGRGTMGVVYKARQSTPGRVVALKMILAGDRATPAERERFRGEAEAATRLRHPHFVPVYEVGEHDGRPFIALEFCEGGNLETKLSRGPLPIPEAARLVETLARAMDDAHRAGIVHRDLKPANVLLTPEGTPRVTDFGLARRLDTTGGTATGDVLGTPNYMAPEQAAGEGKRAGPSADVYSLGAILYDCLTGRPPFLGRTPFETISLVLRSQPVPVRKVRPEVPHDLEAICAHCLHKVPEDRYASALQLAEDLQRFLNSSDWRPPGLLQRVFNWPW